MESCGNDGPPAARHIDPIPQIGLQHLPLISAKWHISFSRRLKSYESNEELFVAE